MTSLSHTSERSFLQSAWNLASEEDRLMMLRSAAIPFPAHDPIESAKQALANLTDLEWQAIWDWLGEMHWLPPGVN